MRYSNGWDENRFVLIVDIGQVNADGDVMYRRQCLAIVASHSRWISEILDTAACSSFAVCVHEYNGISVRVLCGRVVICTTRNFSFIFLLPVRMAITLLAIIAVRIEILSFAKLNKKVKHFN